MHKNDLFKFAIVALAIALSVPIFMVNSATDARSALSTRASHASILIQSNTELATSDAVMEGTGSSDDPYVIENWNIDADGSPYGIMITNTDHYLEIRFNQVFGGGNGGGGIFLRNVTNVVVLSNAIIDSAGYGIVVRSSRSVSLQFNHIRGHGSYGIAVQNSFIMDISDNWIGYGMGGITMNGTAEVRAVHNSLISNEGLGIELASKSVATVAAKNAFIQNNNYGVQASDSGSGNIWYENEEGNYWSDYTIRYPAAKNNGKVWDTMYLIVSVGGSGVPEGDNYPLVRPMDDLPPAISDLELGEGYTGEQFRYSVNIGDDTFVERAEARIWTETEELTPVMLWREDVNDWSLEFNLPNDSTEPIHVVVTAFDLSGNSASSNEGTITVIDDEPPVMVSSTISEVVTTGDAFEVVVKASDNVGIENVWIGYATGSDVLSVEEMEKGSAGEYRKTYVIPHVFEQKGRISISIDDGTFNVTVVDTEFDIVDNDPPSIDGGTGDDIIVGDYVVFHAPNATDNIGIANLTWSFMFRGGHVEVYGDVFNFTFTEPGDYPITLRASDAAGLYDVAYFKVHVAPAPSPPDLDGDGIPDYLDDDDDGDRWPDEIEMEMGLDPMNASSMPLDTDRDWIPDLKDTDDDCDGIDDDLDAFPLDRTEWADLDRDGKGDNVDLDDDNDTMPDLWELTHGLDPTKAVTPDEDADGDGLTNVEEFQKGTDPGSADTDGDGMPDLFEVDNGFDPKVKDSTSDSDDDGYNNLQEYLSGTDPRSDGSVPKEASSGGGKDGIAPGAVVGIAIGAAVATLIVAYISKKGYDYYKASSDLSSSGAMNNPIHEDKGTGGQNPLYEGRTKNKGWDGTVKGSTTKVDDGVSASARGNPIGGLQVPSDKPRPEKNSRRDVGQGPDPDDDGDGVPTDPDERKILDYGEAGDNVADAGQGQPMATEHQKEIIEVGTEDMDRPEVAKPGGPIRGMTVKGGESGKPRPPEYRKGWDGTVKGSTKVQDHNSSRSNKTSSSMDEGGSGSDGETTRSGINTSRSNIKNKGISNPDKGEEGTTRAINHNSTRSNRGNHKAAEVQDHNSSRSNKSSSVLDEGGSGGEGSSSNSNRTKHDTVKNTIQNIR